MRGFHGNKSQTIHDYFVFLPAISIFVSLRVPDGIAAAIVDSMSKLEVDLIIYFYY